ncbi:hypothetical protein E4U35_007941 [Claviceps purpurea]|nr:hypothetical protein E4U28_006860 [Claviceps purpurea]KAG6136193.1 hypothetical protein E4U12_001342 [Claviceps purpurea]KAG6153922.1 hypothetical protein E4U37_002542 [Claviceps purpurea]KAG6195599.1 hypothetical protein E4U10_001749 [Claviceps purpurea]KAG6208887.1 hypothetical protein E4U35_007941 [Claviceps purpurea]
MTIDCHEEANGQARMQPQPWPLDGPRCYLPNKRVTSPRIKPDPSEPLLRTEIRTRLLNSASTNIVLVKHGPLVFAVFRRQALWHQRPRGQTWREAWAVAVLLRQI